MPAGAVSTVPEILTHPQMAERGMFAAFENAPGAGRDIPVARTGFKIDGAAPGVEAPPPRLGEHDEAVHAECGVDQAELKALQAEGVV